MARRKHTLLWVAGAGVAGWAAYYYLYKPWAAAQAAGVGAGGATGLNYYNFLPPAGSMVPSPSQIVGYTSLGPQYSGPVGACISRKGGTWSAAKCEERLNALVAAAQTAKAQIAALKSNTANPNAAGIAATQAQLALTQAALANAQVQYNKAVVANDSLGAAKWNSAIVGHQNDIAALSALIAAAQKPIDNSAAIAAYEGALAGHDADYYALTGYHLLNAA